MFGVENDLKNLEDNILCLLQLEVVLLCRRAGGRHITTETSGTQRTLNINLCDGKDGSWPPPPVRESQSTAAPGSKCTNRIVVLAHAH